MRKSFVKKITKPLDYIQLRYLTIYTGYRAQTQPAGPFIIIAEIQRSELWDILRLAEEEGAAVSVECTEEIKILECEPQLYQQSQDPAGANTEIFLSLYFLLSSLFSLLIFLISFKESKFPQFFLV